MKAFMVSLNGQPFLTAGVGDDGVVVASITWVGGSPPRPADGRLNFHLGGVDGRSGEHVNWSVPEISVGDEITLKIIETSQASPEDARARPNMDQVRAISEEILQDLRPGGSGLDA